MRSNTQKKGEMLFFLGEERGERYLLIAVLRDYLAFILFF